MKSDFIIKNYSNLGWKICSQRTGLSKNQIVYICKKFDLKLNNEAFSISRGKGRKITKPDSEYKVNPSEFCLINTPEKAYILGLLWADGTIYKDNVSLSSTEPDAFEVIPIFMSTGRWNVYRGKVGPRRKKVPISIRSNNRPIADFLRSFSYNAKINSHAGILNVIPTHLKHYWLLGLWDGDGSFFYKKDVTYRASLCSGYTQDWSAITLLLKNLGIEFRVENVKSKNGSYSKIHLDSRESARKLGDFIYQNKIPKLGLNRKYQTFLAIKGS